MADPITFRTFSADTAADAVSVINAYLADWPYVRAVDADLVDHWRTLSAFQPEYMMLVYRSGRAEAFVHGCMRDDDLAVIYLLAVTDGAVDAGRAVLERFVDSAAQAGRKRILGPHSDARFYGGFVLGAEPYHPHWAADATQAYVRAGFYTNGNEVLMGCDLTGSADVDPVADGYDIIEVDPPIEYDARTFGFHAMRDGAKAAHCYGRLYPRLIGQSGLPVGQIGNVTTHEEHRNRGLARVMVQMALQRLGQWGAGEALIATGMTNVPARRCYSRAGFEPRHAMVEWAMDL